MPTCAEPLRLVPGPQGPAGSNGSNGTAGVDAFSTLTAAFTVPAIGATAVATVTSSAWCVVGQPTYLQNGGVFYVTAVADSTHVTLQNPAAETANVAAGTVIPIASKLAPSGFKGPAGSSGAAGTGVSVTTKGDLQGHDGVNPSRQGIGTAGQMIRARAAAGNGLDWFTALPNATAATDDNKIGVANCPLGTEAPAPIQYMPMKVSDTGALQHATGNAKGVDAVDLQPARVNNAQVASGNNSTITGGRNNKSSAQGSTVGGGEGNTASGADSGVASGANNTASGADSVISGGNTNVAGGGQSTIGGGLSNLASGVASTVGGGSGNLASGNESVVAGGQNNLASGLTSTVAGGDANTASSTNAAVVGGSFNVANAQKAFVGGGTSNVASGVSSSILGGANNVAAAQGSVAFGETNVIDAAATDAVILGGASNSIGALAANAAIISGLYGKADLFGQICRSPGRFSTTGDAQGSDIIFKVETTNATANVEAFIGPASQRAVMWGFSSWAFHIMTVARNMATDLSAVWETKGGVKRSGGVISLIGAVTHAKLCDDGEAWMIAGGVLVDADIANVSLRLRVTGAAATTIRWVATCRLTQVGY